MELRTKIISYKYDTDVLLKDIDIIFKENNIYCLVGNNGTGKTTFLNIISKLIPNVVEGCLVGDITLNGSEVHYSDIDYVFQNSENSFFYNKVCDQLSHVDLKNRMFWLKQVKLSEYHTKYISELSIGQKKIVACLSALLSNRKICILDEPTANLDDNNKKILLSLIEENKKNKIIIIVSHDDDLIKKADVIYKLNNKKLITYNRNEKNEVFIRKKHLNKNKTEDTLLRLNGFKYFFENGNTFNCSDQISIPRNSIVCMLGGNGSGKTTFANYVLKNHKTFLKTGVSSKKITCSVMFQNFYRQFFEFSVEKELEFGIKTKDRTFESEKILKKFGLYDKKNMDPRFLSDGKKRILLICSILMSRKDLVILDEPFDNIDEESKLELKKILKQYKKNGGSIVILDQTDIDFYDIVDYYIEINGVINEKI